MPRPGRWVLSKKSPEPLLVKTMLVTPPSTASRSPSRSTSAKKPARAAFVPRFCPLSRKVPLELDAATSNCHTRGASSDENSLVNPREKTTEILSPARKSSVG